MGPLCSFSADFIQQRQDLKGEAILLTIAVIYYRRPGRGPTQPALEETYPRKAIWLCSNKVTQVAVVGPGTSPVFLTLLQSWRVISLIIVIICFITNKQIALLHIFSIIPMNIHRRSEILLPASYFYGFAEISLEGKF